MKTIEWPPSSGRQADYSTAELALVRKLREQYDAGAISRAELETQVGVLHDLKVECDASVVEDEPQAATRAFARTTDPETSRAAAASLSPETLRASQRQVLDAFRRFGQMHHERLIERYDGDPQSDSGLRTRTRELVDAGLLRDSGERVLLSSRRQAIVWELTDRGRA